jgi:hypothetical protein
MFELPGDRLLLHLPSLFQVFSPLELPAEMNRIKFNLGEEG